jgi:hypothetical protein
MSTASTVETQETVSLIASDKVEGTAVYGVDEKKIGKLERVMIDKISGKVAHAVMSFGGFMGMGEDYYPVPWSMLKYDTNLGGYRVNLTKVSKPNVQEPARSISGSRRSTSGYEDSCAPSHSVEYIYVPCSPLIYRVLHFKLESALVFPSERRAALAPSSYFTSIA